MDKIDSIMLKYVSDVELFDISLYSPISTMSRIILESRVPNFRNRIKNIMENNMNNSIPISKENSSNNKKIKINKNSRNNNKDDIKKSNTKTDSIKINLKKDKNVVKFLTKKK